MKKGIKIIALGAVLWDIIGEKEYIGGAPFNFLVNTSKIGAKTLLVTSVGNDARGKRAIEKIKYYNVLDKYAQISKKEKTGYAKASLDKDGNAIYDIPYAAFDEIYVDETIIQDLNNFKSDILYFGSFEQRNLISRETIQTILNQVKTKCVFFDVNIRMGFADKEILSFSFEKSNIVKLNDEEMTLISKLFYGENVKEENFASRLIDDYNLDCLIITLGEKGCNVYNKDKIMYHSNPISVKNADTIGAGDAFSAAFVCSYLSGEGLEKAANKGNILGSFVASQHGALPEFDEELLEKLQVKI